MERRAFFALSMLATTTGLTVGSETAAPPVVDLERLRLCADFVNAAMPRLDHRGRPFASVLLAPPRLRGLWPAPSV